jgi:hypothetical protein
MSATRERLIALERAQVIDPLDRRVAEALARLTGEDSADMAVVVALAVRAPRQGDAHLDLDHLDDPVAHGLVDPEADGATDVAAVLALLPSSAVARAACQVSPIVAVVDGGDVPVGLGDRPLVLRGRRLATDRLDRAEGRLARALGRLIDRDLDATAVPAVTSFPT